VKLRCGPDHKEPGVYLEGLTSDGVYVLTLRPKRFNHAKPGRALEVFMGPSAIWAVSPTTALLQACYMVVKARHTPCYHVWVPLEGEDEDS
jgi:hypothetical protein